MLTEYNPASHLIHTLFYIMMAVIAFMVAVELCEGLFRTVSHWLRVLRGEAWTTDEAHYWEDNPTAYSLEKPEGALRRHIFHRFRMRNFSWSNPGTRLMGEAPTRTRLRIGKCSQ